MNWLTIVIGIIFLLFVINGYRKGLVRKITGVASVILSAVLVSVALPYISDFIRESTPVYQIVEQKCEEVLVRQLTGESGDTGRWDRDAIRQQMEWYGLDTGIIDPMSEQELDTYIQQYFPEYYQLHKGSVSVASVGKLNKVEQTKLIQDLPVPDFVEELMLNYNNSEGYKRLQVTDFVGYLAGFFTNLVLNIISFLITFLIVQMIVRMIFAALNLFADIPGIHAIDHAGGLVIGIVEGVLAVWLIMLVISMLSGTQFGMELMKMVDNSILLKPLYNQNLFFKIIMNALDF